MCLLKGILLPLILVLIFIPVVFMMLGRGLLAWRMRGKTGDRRGKSRDNGDAADDCEPYDVARDDVIDPAKIEYIDYEEVKKDDE